MKTTTLLGTAALVLLATASASLAADARPILGDDYSRYSSIDGPNAPLTESFAPNRDDALLTDVYGPYDYLFLLHEELVPNAIRTAAASAPADGPAS